MPIFFFDLHDQSSRTIDEEGVDLAGLDAAQRLAIEALGQAILDGADRAPTGIRRVEVRDTTGRFVLRAAAAVTLDRTP